MEKTCGTCRNFEKEAGSEDWGSCRAGMGRTRRDSINPCGGWRGGGARNCFNCRWADIAMDWDGNQTHDNDSGVCFIEQVSITVGDAAESCDSFDKWEG